MLYIGFFGDEKSSPPRNHSPAAVNKMRYIAGVLSRFHNVVEIVSPSWQTDESIPKTSETVVFLSEKILLRKAPTKPNKTRSGRYLRTWKSRFWLFRYLMKNTKKDESVLCYHSLMLILPVLAARFFRKFRLVLETEEIYKDAVKLSPITQALEQIMFRCADAFLFITDNLGMIINKNQREQAVVCGTYKSENLTSEKRDDGKIHLVYAGTFDKTKGGALLAARAGILLPEYFQTHIIGFGTIEEENELRRFADLSGGKVCFDGFLSGKSYNEFLQSCHIGLACQDSDGKFAASSFPSKVLSYLSNGLRVVTVKIPALTDSPVSDVLNYYEGSSPQALADAILGIDFESEFDTKKFLNKLDSDAERQLRELIPQL